MHLYLDGVASRGARYCHDSHDVDALNNRQHKFSAKHDVFFQERRQIKLFLIIGLLVSLSFTIKPYYGDAAGENLTFHVSLL